jgi:predicted DNA-binding protein (UPF0251 family)
MTKRASPNAKSRRRGPKPTAKSPKNSHTSLAHIKLSLRQREALELRLNSYTYEQIADEMKIATSTVYEYVDHGMRNIVREPAEKVLALYRERLERLLSSVMPAALSGDLPAHDAALRIMDRMLALEGLSNGLNQNKSNSNRRHDGEAPPDDDGVPTVRIIVEGGLPKRPPPPMIEGTATEVVEAKEEPAVAPEKKEGQS